MIVVDSSVWIDHLNNQVTPEVRHLRTLIGREAILVGDLILLEVLQGLPAGEPRRLAAHRAPAAPPPSPGSGSRWR